MGRRFSLSIAVLLLIAAPAHAAPARVFSLGVPVSGLVAKRLVADGAHVDAGQGVLQMDCRLDELAITARAAEADAAEAVYERVRNGPRPDEIAIGEANIGVAKARAEEADDAYKRLLALTEGVSVTKAQLLLGRRDARITAAQPYDAQKRLDLLDAGSRAEDIAEALARRNAAAAELSLAKARLDQGAVRAPAAGVIAFAATPGEYVSESVPTTLATLTPDAPAH